MCRAGKTARRVADAAGETREKKGQDAGVSNGAGPHAGAALRLTPAMLASGAGGGAGASPKRGKGRGRRRGGRGGSAFAKGTEGGAEPRVILLPLALGASGLNLTEANHVVFCEPLLDPAEASQAVGRVHRIGQERECVVHHFVVEATVEQNVAALSEERRAAMDMSAVGAAQGGHKAEGLSVMDVARLLRL